ncbi:uncharacterized protein [Drosophila takahashii]|uniref:uncharacterized protein n=1 Tax=Drosophila takahashii TaxID=29030 RepID=UPI0038992E81
MPVTTTIPTSAPDALSNITENSLSTQQTIKEIFNNTEILKKENDLVITRILTPPEDLEVSEEDVYAGSGDYNYESEIKETPNTTSEPVTTTTTTTRAPEVLSTSTENSSITDQSNQEFLNNTHTLIKENDAVLTRLSTPPEDLEVSEEVEGSGDHRGSGDHHGSGDHQGSGDGFNGPQIEGTPSNDQHLINEDISSNILENQKEDFYFQSNTKT